MRKTEERGAWYLLTGLVIGILLGVTYSRYFQPVEYIDTDPSTLRSDYKDQYRALIAAAYLENGDLLRASARLELLKDPDIFRALTEQAQRALAKDGASTEARALGLLAIALGQEPPGSGQAITQPPRSPTGSPILATPANPAGSTQDASVPIPVISVTSAAGGETLPPTEAPQAESFNLQSKEEICDLPLPEPLVQVEVHDQAGNPVSGVLVIITWAGGEERFFTGLKPELGTGYADFSLDPDFVYSLRLGEEGAILGDISAVSCTSSTQGAYWGALKVVFGLP